MSKREERLSPELQKDQRREENVKMDIGEQAHRPYEKDKPSQKETVLRPIKTII